MGEGEGVSVHVDEGTSGIRGSLEGRSGALERMARVSELVWGAAPDGVIGAHGVLKSGADLFLPFEGVVDLERERERLRTEIERVTSLLQGTTRELDNASFVERAPAEVVDREREKARSQTERLASLREKLALFEGQG